MTMVAYGSPEPDPFQGSVHANEHLRQVIVDAIIQAEVDALNRNYGPFRTRTFRGVVAYFQALQYLGYGLVGTATQPSAYGFTWEEVLNQVRFVSPEGLFQQRCRILFCRGKKRDGYFVVPKKGDLSAYLINHENDYFNLTASLFAAPSESDSEHIANFWIVSDVDKYNNAAIYFVFPANLSPGGTRLRYDNQACTCIWLGNLTTSTHAEEAPPSETVHIDLEDNETA